MRYALGLVVGLLAVQGALAQPAAKAEAAGFVARLADGDYRERERAGAELLKLGDAAIPVLQAALPLSADPEATRRLEVLLRKLESARLGSPRRVTLKVERKPARKVFDDLAELTGYKFRFDATPERVLVSFDWRGTPFLRALDELCDVANLCAYPDDIDGVIVVQGNDSVNPHVAYAGPFRVIAANVGSNRTLQLSGLPRRTPVPRQPDYVNLMFTVTGEPKAMICGVASVALSRAVDDRKNSLLFPDGNNPEAIGPDNNPPADMPPPTTRSYTGSTSAVLLRTDRLADSVAELRGKVTVAVLAEARPEIVVENPAAAKGKKFNGRQYLLEVGAVTAVNNEVQVEVTLRRKYDDGNDGSWLNGLHQRFEAFDTEGRPLRFNGTEAQNNGPNFVALTYRFGRPNSQKPPKLGKLQLVEWVIQHKEIEFTLKDIPLP